MSFNFSLFFIQEELRQMSRYLDVVASALDINLQNASSAFEKAMEETAEEVSDDYVEWVISTHQDDLIEAGEDFPQLLLISFVILWYSFVEQKLIDFCEELNLTISISPKSNENFDKGIRRAQKFLSQAKNYEIHPEHWQELLYVGKLRNLLVHDGRRLKLSYVKPEIESVIHKVEGSLDLYIPIKTDLYKYLDKHKLFRISSVDFNITPSIDYCKGLVKFGDEIFRKLHNDFRSKEL